jgi:hypothetical protein
MHSIAVIRATSGDCRSSTSFSNMNGYMNLPMMIYYSDDDYFRCRVRVSMWDANRVIELDDGASEQNTAAHTTWEVSCWHLNFQTRLGSNKAVLSRLEW